jgi:pimeloyl-ACP methyl ester carboxylesterase
MAYVAAVPVFPPSVRAWLDRGRHVQLAGLDVFVVDEPAGASASPSPATPLVILHGFPTSSHDWHLTLAGLTRERRVVLLDFPGFGLSEKPVDYSYSLHEQTDLVPMLLRHLEIERAHVVGHDMGTSIATELVARRERGLLGFEMKSLTLMNGSVHIELSQLTPSQKILRTRLGPWFVRLSSWRVFRAQMRRILARPVSDEELSAMWAQLRYRDGLARLPSTISYVAERYRFWHRWIGALTRADVPVLIAWGPEDPVAVMAIGEKLAGEIPGARLERLEGLGHYPMVEDPDRTVTAITRFLREHD